MTHFILFLLCIFSIEIFQRTKLLLLVSKITLTAKKVSRLIPNGRISDHWKELLIPHYALTIMKCSMQILSVLVLIILIFAITDYFIEDFLSYTLSIIGIIESILFAYLYILLKKYIR